MKFRLFGALLMATLLLAACGRRLPEDGVVSSASGAAVAEAPTTDEQADSADVEAAEVDEASEEDTDTEVDDAEAEEAATADEAADEDADANAETEDSETADDAEAEDAADEAEAETVAGTGDPALGQTVFNETYDTASGPWICASCHSVDESQLRLVGPGLWGLAGEIGEQRIAETGDSDVTEYIRNSIIHPNDHIVPGDSAGPYPENLMPQNYEDLFSDEELDGLVAYIMTLQ